MNTIKFSHEYPKLHGQTSAELLAVFARMTIQENKAERERSLKLLRLLELSTHQTIPALTIQRTASRICLPKMCMRKKEEMVAKVATVEEVQPQETERREKMLSGTASPTVVVLAAEG